MNQREKLLVFLAAGLFNFSKDGIVDISKFTDYLLENGVKVPKCKVGDKVYFVFFDDEQEAWDYCDTEIKDVCDRGIFVSPYIDEKEGNSESWELTKFGDEDMFLTLEEAKKAVKERSGKE